MVGEGRGGGLLVAGCGLRVASCGLRAAGCSLSKRRCFKKKMTADTYYVHLLLST